MCDESYVPGTLVTVTAVPAEGSSFGGWNRSRDSGSGPGAEACAGQTFRSCAVTVDVAKTITASFVPTPRRLKVAKVGSGAGTVTGLEINCGTHCTGTYPGFVEVLLTATPAAGSSFAGWTECDSANGRTCTMNMTGDKDLTAAFAKNKASPPPPPPPPPRRGTGAPVAVAGCTSPPRDVIPLGAGNDLRTGTAGDDMIFAGAGTDVIDGLAGDDCFDLGIGNDRGQGGPGDDLVLGGRGNDSISGSPREEIVYAATPAGIAFPADRGATGSPGAPPTRSRRVTGHVNASPAGAGGIGSSRTASTASRGTASG